MVTPARVSMNTVSNGIVILKGGINESVSNLELKGGELIEDLNYFEIDGPYHGYTSVAGYEVFDGSEAPSSIPLVENLDGTIDDTAREARRSAITQVPGSGAIRGVHQYNAMVFSARDTEDGLSKDVFYADPTTLWTPVTTSGDLNPGGVCDWANGIFSAYPVQPDPEEYPPVITNSEVFIMVDGVSKPIVCSGTTVEVVDDIRLPSSATDAPIYYPTHVTSFDNRAWLAYPNGNLFYSELGNPAGFDAVNGAGSIMTGDEITDLVQAPGDALVVFMRNSTKIIYIVDGGTSGFVYQLKEFSQRSGCFLHGANRMLGDVHYVDDRGPTKMKSSDTFGDFDASTLTKKVQRTFLEKKDTFSCSVVVRSVNQWRLFFGDGFGMCLTFKDGYVKGVGFFQYLLPVVCVCEGEDDRGDITLFFGSDDGYVYQADSGTSFNGEAIETKMVTSYYHYKSPRIWKRFLRSSFEMAADNGTTFYVRADFDYRDIDSPKNSQTPIVTYGGGSLWGEGTWGVFVWGSSVIQTPTIYTQGYGYNMSLTVRTLEKYKTQHVIENFIADYQLLSQKM